VNFLNKRMSLEQQLYDNKQDAIVFIVDNYEKVKDWSGLIDLSFSYYWTGEGSNQEPDAEPGEVTFFNFEKWQEQFASSKHTENIIYNQLYSDWIELRKEMDNPLKSIDGVILDVDGDFCIKANGLWYNWIEGGEEELADYISKQLNKETDDLR